MTRAHLSLRKLTRDCLLLATLATIGIASTGCIVRAEPPPPRHDYYDRPYEGAVWIPGHWHHGYYGDRWVPGHWE